MKEVLEGGNDDAEWLDEVVVCGKCCKYFDAVVSIDVSVGLDWVSND